MVWFGRISFAFKIKWLRKIDELITLHYLDLFKIASFYESDILNKEDLVHDTILKAIKSFHCYESGTNFMGWLAVIMKNTFIDKCRKSKRCKIIDIDFATDVKKDFNTVFGKMELNELNKLPNVLKMPMLLFVEGYKYEEISTILSRPINTIKSDIFKARKKMQQIR